MWTKYLRLHLSAMIVSRCTGYADQRGTLARSRRMADSRIARRNYGRPLLGCRQLCSCSRPDKTAKGDLIMKDRFGNNGYRVSDNCEVDAGTRVNLLKHLDQHGPVSLLTSAKFGQYAGCFLEEIERAIVAESTLITPDADDLTEKGDAAASPADEATESPAAMRVRLQSGRRMTSYRQGRS